jgi:hypothetical protein
VVPAGAAPAPQDHVRVVRAELLDWQLAFFQQDGRLAAGGPQDAGIKLGPVASSIATNSGRLMTGALIDGERRGAVLADLAIGRMRPKIPYQPMTLGMFDSAERTGGHPAALVSMPLGSGGLFDGDGGTGSASWCFTMVYQYLR